MEMEKRLPPDALLLELLLLLSNPLLEFMSSTSPICLPHVSDSCRLSPSRVPAVLPWRNPGQVPNSSGLPLAMADSSKSICCSSGWSDVSPCHMTFPSSRTAPHDDLSTWEEQEGHQMSCSKVLTAPVALGGSLGGWAWEYVLAGVSPVLRLCGLISVTSTEKLTNHGMPGSPAWD